MRIVAMFFWLAVPMAAYVTYTVYGLPHVIWSYRFHPNGDPHNPLKARYYTQCTFVGPYGVFTVDADRGKCGWVKLFRPGADQ